MHLSLPYVQWMLAGSPLLFVYIIYTSILRGVGDSTTPLLALALTSVIGLVITPILLKGYFGLPALGIIAPAIATITGYVAILIFLAIYLNKKKHPLRPNRQLLQHIRHNSALSKNHFTPRCSNWYSNDYHFNGRFSHCGFSEPFRSSCHSLRMVP